MDHEPTLREGILRIRDSLQNYAKSHGWKPESYRILMDIHETWGVITVVFFSESFKRKNFDEMKFYNEVMDAFEGDLKEYPDLYEATELLLRPLDEYFVWGDRGHVPDIFVVDDKLLNPEIGVEHLRGPIGRKM